MHHPFPRVALVVLLLICTFNPPGIGAAPTVFCRSGWAAASKDSISLASGASITGPTWVGTLKYGSGFNPAPQVGAGPWNRCEDLPSLSGTTAVNVSAGGSASRGRGGYGAVTVGNGATLTLTGARYSFASLTLGQGANLVFASDSGVILEVRGAMTFQGTVGWTLQKIPANRLLISLPTASTVAFPSGQQLKGTFYAPNAVVTMPTGVGINGAVWAKTVKVGQGSFITGSPWKARVKITSPPNDSTVRAISTRVRWTADSTNQTQDTLESWSADGTYWIARCAWGVCDSVRVTRTSFQPVHITSPTNGTNTNKTKQPVAWTVGGISQPVDTALLVEGLNTIKRCSNGVCDSVVVRLDTQDPVVQILSPSNGTWTNKSKVAVSWAVDGIAKSDSALLLEGSNTITRSWTDSAGNVGTASVSVKLDTQAPIVQITNPASGAVFSDSIALLQWTVDGAPFQAERILAQGLNTLRVSFVDSAGNQGADSVVVTFQGAPPVVTIIRPFDGAILATNRIEVVWEVDSTTHSDTATLVEGANIIRRSGANQAGISATDSIRVVVDTQAPDLTWLAPVDSTLQADSNVVVDLRTSDAGSGISSIRLRIDGDELGGFLQPDTGSRFIASLPAGRGWHTMSLSALDYAGNSVSLPDRRILTGVAQSPIHINSPLPLAMLSSLDVQVSGTTDVPLNDLKIDGVVPALVDNRFQATVSLLEGRNTLTVSGIDVTGSVKVATVTVIVDRTAPDIRIEYPKDGDVVRQPRLAVSGTVSDRIISMAQAAQSGVKINGDSASVSNESFLGFVNLVPGENSLNAIATDPFGNASGRTVRVTYDTARSVQLALLGDSVRRGKVREFLRDSIEVRLLDAMGQPLAGDTILFRVIQGSGVVSGSIESGARLGMAVTDAQGIAKTGWRMGRRAGPGANRLRAQALHDKGTVEVVAEGIPDTIGLIQASGGDHQRGAAGYPAPFPIVALANDTLDNPLVGVPVVFRAVAGGGHFNGVDSVVVVTGADGKASATWTLGPADGIENNRVEATFAGCTSLPAVFQASGLIPGNIDSTHVSGLVLDNQNRPIPNATLVLDELGTRAYTDTNGFFRMRTPTTGIHHLTAVGSTSTRPGKWVGLHFELNIVAGRDNTLGMPIYLLAEAENPLSVKVPKVDSAVTLKVPEVPGFALTIPPGSARFPFTADDSRRAVSVSQVHMDKIPMPPGDGMQPVVIVSIMPHDVRFDIPAPVSFPNVDRLPPGEQTSMYSFDHDLGTFVKIGTGTVSEDGAVIQSDPGYGIVHGGWHCAGPGNETGSAECLKVKPNEGVDLPIGAKGDLGITKIEAEPPPGEWVFAYELDPIAVEAKLTMNTDVAEFKLTAKTETKAGTGVIKGTYTTESGSVDGELEIRVGMGKLQRHPTEGASGNAYGYEESVPYLDGASVDHVSVAVGMSTRIVFKATGAAWAKAIAPKVTGTEYTASVDEGKCDKVQCELVIKGVTKTPTGYGDLAQYTGRKLFVHFKNHDKVMVDSVMVNVYLGSVESDDGGANLGGDGSALSLNGMVVHSRSNRLNINKSSSVNAMNRALKYLVRKAVIGDLMDIFEDDLGEQVVPFWVIQLPGSRSIANSADDVVVIKNRASKVYGNSAVILQRDMRFVFPIVGQPKDGGNYFDVLEFSQADQLSRNHKTGDECEAIDFSTGQSYACKYTGGGMTTPKVEVGIVGMRPSSNKIGVVFSKGNPQAFEYDKKIGLADKAMIVTVKGAGNSADLIGKIFAHEIGHMLDLDDVSDRGNIMNYYADWESSLLWPFTISGKTSVISGVGTPVPGGLRLYQWEEVGGGSK